ncbi:MAG TPA: isoprenylcysteine carboxylmethyltransferase family protein [Terriglobales bacterium]|nr:isoprenylcysteine carboxylmethyltransferase family protein [Terriglobales bacterium]
MSGDVVIALLLVFVTMQRLSELVIARRNTRLLLAAGAHEIGAGHYRVMVVLHSCWLLALWAAWLMGRAELQPGAACLYLLLQPLRFWTMASLGRYWTTRIIVVPDAPLVRAGPYRYLRHPNYLIVVMEILLLPLALGLWPLAVIFSLLNAAMLRHRLAVEGDSLRQRESAADAASRCPIP